MKSNEGGLRRAQTGVKGHGQTLPRLSHPSGAARSALRTPRARPRPRWPRSLQPLPPPAPSAHVPKAALRRRPDWQHAPANGGGERFLPANGGGAPRGQRAGRVCRRRGATVRRPMAAPEVRRGSAPTAPGGWGGDGCRGNRRPGGEGPLRYPLPLAQPGTRRGTWGRAAELRLLRPPAAGRCPVPAGLPSPPRLPLPPAPAGSGLRPARG